MARHTWREIALAATLVVASVHGQRALATEAVSLRAIEVAPGPLVKALDEFSRLANQKLEFDRKSLDGRDSAGVQGRYSNLDALAALLKGADAHYEVRNGTVVVVADPITPHQRLATVVVNAPTTFSALRGDNSLRDVPQSVQVMSAKQLDEQNSSTLADAMNRAVGITVANVTDNMPVFSARGFRVTNVHVDSGAQMDMVSSATLPLAGITDMGAYDRIEILRGADALFGGSGNPGASISLIRKEPLYKNQATVDLSAGSWNRYRAEVDGSAVLTEDGALRVRGDIVSLSNDYFYDNTYMRFSKAYGVLAYDLSPSTTLQIGGSYSRQNSRDAGTGLPRFPDGADANLPRSFALTFPWAFYKKQSAEVFAKVNHEINDNWHVKANVTYVDGKAEYANAQFQDPLSPVTYAVLGKPNVTYSLDPDTNKQVSGDITLTGSFTTLGRKTDLMLGADYQNFKGTQRFQYISGYPFFSTGNVLTMDPATFTDPRLNPATASMAITSTSLQKQRSSGFYGSVRMHVTDNLAITLGGRRSDYATASKATSALGTFIIDNSGPPSKDKTFTPFGGAVYDLSDTASIYYSYADIFFPNFGKKTKTGDVLGSVSGVNNELGIKKSWDGGRLNGSFAFYSIRQTNLALFDLSAPSNGDPNCCYYPGGLNTSRGVEAELSGKITPHWDASVGYTLNNNKAQYGEVLGTFTPKHLLKLWTSYRLPEPFDRFTIGGNVLAQSSNYVTGTYFIGRYCSGVTVHCGDGVYTFKDSQGGYVVTDLRVAYKISPTMTLSATLNNVADIRYFSLVGAPYAGSAYGTPRNFLLKLEAKI